MTYNILLPISCTSMSITCHEDKNDHDDVFYYRFLDTGLGTGDGSSYGTGGAYGGRGGRSTSTTKTGNPYGDYVMPQAFGSGGGKGGSSGGVLRLYTLEALAVEGKYVLIKRKICNATRPTVPSPPPPSSQSFVHLLNIVHHLYISLYVLNLSLH